MKDKEILEWLKEHKAISINKMCREVGIDGANFHTNLKAGRIIKKHIDKVESYLSEYGLGCNCVKVEQK